MRRSHRKRVSIDMIPYLKLISQLLKTLIKMQDLIAEL